MKSKVQNIITHLEKNGRVLIKLDRECGFTRITITKSVISGFTLSTTPPSNTLKRISYDEVVELLEHNSMFIESWS